MELGFPMSCITLLPTHSARFREDWIHSLCNWIQTEEELIYWSGNTFSGKKFCPRTLRNHLKNQNILPVIRFNENQSLISYGEIVQHEHKEHVNLCRIIVHPDARGIGIGKEFCKTMLERIKYIAPKKSIRLNVLEANKRAISCYSSSGFRIIGKITNARKIGNQSYNLILMSKNF